MAKEKKAAKTAPTSTETKPVEAWFEVDKTPAWARAGFMVHHGFGRGKLLTESQFTKAKEAFLTAPMDGSTSPGANRRQDTAQAVIRTAEKQAAKAAAKAEEG